MIRSWDRQPRRLDSRYLYDAAGSEIFERITEQPEYYQTLMEDELLARHAGAIRSAAGDATLIELGSGSSRKTRHLIEAFMTRGPSRYVPIDISAVALESACAALHARYPQLAVDGLAATYHDALPLCRPMSPSMFFFLGSSIGNLDEPEMHDFLQLLAAHMTAGDSLLLGIDLLKSRSVIEAAYNDVAGYSAAFNRNLFARMNQTLGCDIPLEAIEHVARYSEAVGGMEIFVRFTRAVEFRLSANGRLYRIAAGEMIRTQISRKFDIDLMATTAAQHGLPELARFCNETRAYGLLLLQRAS